MKGIKSAFSKVQKVNTVLIGLALAAIILVVFMQTFFRFVIFRSLSWSEELSRYLFVMMIVLGVNLAISKHMCVRIEIIDNYLKGSAAIFMTLVRKFVMIFVNVIFVYSSYELIIIGGYQTSPAMGWPMSLLYGVIFIGFILNVLASLIDLYDTYVMVENGKEEK